MNIDPNIKNRLFRALNGTNPQNAKARVVVSEVTLRELDPLTGSKSLQGRACGKGATFISLNTSDGGRKAIFNLGGGFGFGATFKDNE